MNSRVRYYLMGTAAAVAVLLAAGPAMAQDSKGKTAITGTVIDLETGEPIIAAFVSAGDVSAMTDDNGRYILEVTPGKYTVVVAADGYQDWSYDVEAQKGAAVELDVKVVPGEVIVIVGVGSRTKRTKLETPAPVDVISADEINRSAAQETSQILAEVVPSYNSTHQTISDGTDHVNPASLRGLGPDQTLVLINGKRRHSSALVNVNGTFGRGSVSTDLNAIPSTAIKRIEVLRDGAAAQYGSDAIAGVVNIVLKDYTDVLEFNTRAGISGSRDGEELKAGANWGYKLGKNGKINLTVEAFFRGQTQRADPWSGQIFPNVTDPGATDQLLAQAGLTREDFTMNVGQSAAAVGNVFFNGEYKLPIDGMTAYGFGGYTYRKGYASGFYRLPYQSERVDLDIHPNGFLPEINPEMQDWSLGGGVRGKVAGIDLDVSSNYGGNTFLFLIDNSLNASLGDASPTSFDAGGQLFQQATVNVDGVKPLKIGGVDSFNVVFGTEFRFENYQVTAGDNASWATGLETYIDEEGIERPKTPGAQVFPGYQPDNEVDEWRNSQSLYAGVESNISKKILVDAAARFENYSDFGNAFSFKLAGRFKATDKIGIRATASNGFRAPSLHQIYYSSISTQFVDIVQPDGSTVLEPKQVLTANNPSPLAKAFGIPDLKKENAINISAGVTAQLMEELSLSADVYRTAITDRIVLSSRFSDAQAAEALMAFPGVSQAQFFMNAIDTTTLGADVVANYEHKFKNGAKVGLSAVVNVTNTSVDNVNVADTLRAALPNASDEEIQDIIFNREEKNRYEDALPRQRASLTARYREGKVSLLGRAKFYGAVEYKPTDEARDETFGTKVIFDTDLGYQMGKWRMSLGANNLLNTFPDKHTNDANISNGRFVYSRRVSQFGIMGGYYYLRFQYFN